VTDAIGAWTERDTLEVAGPDAASFLQGQLSQDIEALVSGASAWSFLLQPTGKVDSLLRVLRVDGDTFLLDVDAGFGDHAAARLQRFKLRTRCEITSVSRRYLLVRGSSEVVVPPSAVALQPGWGEGVDLSGEDLALPDGVDEAGAGWLEAARIEACFPSLGRDLDERTIPGETGILDRTVSFTKGCYTGQELVARIDSRGGNVPRHLRLLVAAAPLTPGEDLTLDGTSVGQVTSAAWSPSRQAHVALAYLKRAVEPGATVAASSGPAEVAA
jgi:folate-binding protein YgfZ